MFCRKCGYQLADDAKFCPGCGEKVVRDVTSENVEKNNNYFETSQPQYEESKQEYTEGNATKSGDEEKINWKEFLTIEKFAPIVALVLLAMAVVCGVLGGILFATVGKVAIGKTICKITIIILKALFIIATAGATGGLVYVIANKKNPSVVNTWVTPFGTLMATISCLGIAFGWGLFRGCLELLLCCLV